MFGPPKIAVATPASNWIATIREIIERVRTQDCKNWEHIVIDGRSIDGTVEPPVIYAHLQWVPEKDIAVKCTT
jgi:glycosyltransferase involved in cell wall biosynthesis